MTLSALQALEIEGSIDFLFDLPSNLQELRKSLSHIHKAFKNEEKSSDPFFTLQQFIHDPLNTFGHLENSNDSNLPPVTIGEVQEYIAKIAAKKLSSVNRIKFESKKWLKQVSTILKANAHYSNIFASQRSLPGNFQLPPPRSPSPEPVVYQFKTRAIPEEKTFMVDVEVNLGNGNEPIKTTSETIFNEQPDITEAKISAVKTACDVVIATLLENKLISMTDIQDMNDLTYEILTNPFYLKMILEKSLPFSEIKRLNAQEQESLCSPITITLIREGKCSIAIAKRLHKDLIEDHFYCSRINAGTLSLETLRDVLQDFQIRILTCPVIKLLIAEGHLSIESAITMSPSCGQLLLQDGEFYSQKIRNRELDITEILAINEPQCIFLLSDEIISSLREEFVNMNDILRLMNNSILVFLINKKIISLENAVSLFPTDITNSVEPQILAQYSDQSLKVVMQQFIELAEMGLLFADDLNLVIEQMPQIMPHFLNHESKDQKSDIRHLLEFKFIMKSSVSNLQERLKAIHHYKPFNMMHGEDQLENIVVCLEKNNINHLNLWANLFFVRLDAIFWLNHPYKIFGRTDTVAQIMKDMHDVIAHFNFSRNQLHDQVLQFLIEACHKQAHHAEAKEMHEFIGTELFKAKTNLTTFHATESSWKCAFHNVVLKAQQDLNLASYNESSAQPHKKRKGSFFPPFEKQMSDKHQELCQSIINLEKQLHNFEPVGIKDMDNVQSMSRKRKRS